MSQSVSESFLRLFKLASQLKNKKKIGSNDENLRKLEPEQKQRVLIKKKV